MRDLFPLRTVNGVIGGDVQVFRVVGHREIFWDIRVVPVFWAAYHFHIAEQFRFLDGFAAPDARIGVCRAFFVIEQVHGYLHELRRCAAM